MTREIANVAIVDTGDHHQDDDCGDKLPTGQTLTDTSQAVKSDTWT